MPDNPAGNIKRNSLVLGGFCLAVALVMATVNLVTAGRIEQQRLAAERRALAAVMPGEFHDNDLPAAAFLLDPANPAAWQMPGILTLAAPRQGYIARRDGEFAGAIVPVDARDGYSGRIALLVGILEDGTLSGVRVIEHRETPGLGDKIDAAVSDWILDFNGASLGNPPVPRWRVAKDGGDFDQLVGATVTPRAVVDAVRRALEFFAQNRTQLANTHAD